MATLALQLADEFPGLDNTRWVALRLLEGDPSIEAAVRDGIVESLYTAAARITSTSLSHDSHQARLTFDRLLDRALTHRVWGFVVMGVLFFGVFWFTIIGAASPSGWLMTLLVDNGHEWLRSVAVGIGPP